jgi:hypothetical protein
MAGVIESPVFPLGLPDPDIRLIGVSLSDTASYGSGAVAARIDLVGSALVDSPSFGGGEIIVGGYTIVDDETDTFTPTLGSGLVQPGSLTLSGSGLQDSEAFGSGLVQPGEVNVVDDETDTFPVTFGQGVVEPGVRIIPGTGLSDPVTFGSGTMRPGERIIVDTSNDNFAPTLGSGNIHAEIFLDGYGIWPDTKYGQGSVQPTRYYFVGPQLRYGHGRKHSPLWWVENVDGITVLRENGTWRETLAPTGDEIAAAERAYRGGYRTELTGTQKNELVAAGYGSYIEED